MKITAKKLEKLLGKIIEKKWRYDTTGGELVGNLRTCVHAHVWGPDLSISTCQSPNPVADMKLIAMAPDLARIVIAAEKLVGFLEENYYNSEDVMSMAAAYREAFK